MSATAGKAIIEVEEQLQAVLASLKRFERATAKLDQGRESLDAAAEQVQELMNQAALTLQPAAEAVAELRRLNPDWLLEQVSTAASAVQEQLDRAGHHVSTAAATVQEQLDRVEQQALTAASTVQEQLDRVEQEQRGELQRARTASEAAVTVIRSLGESVPASLTRVQAELVTTKALVGSSRLLLYGALGVGLLNVVLIGVLLIR